MLKHNFYVERDVLDEAGVDAFVHEKRLRLGGESFNLKSKNRASSDLELVTSSWTFCAGMVSPPKALMTVCFVCCYTALSGHARAAWLLTSGLTSHEG